MELPNNKGDNAPTRHSSPANETSHARIGLYLIELWTRGPHGNSQTT